MAEVIAMPGVEVEPVDPLELALDFNEFHKALRLAAEAHPLEDPREVGWLLERAQAGKALVGRVVLGSEQLAVVALEIKTTDCERILWIRYCSGSAMEQWLDVVMNWIQQVARAEGCDRIGLLGRRGWVRELSRFGYAPVAVQMLCEVAPDEQRLREVRE